MKIADVAHAGVRTGARSFWHIPRIWVVLGAALGAWMIFAAIGAVLFQIFSMILAHF